jgi:hypothetical protein
MQFNYKKVDQATKNLEGIKKSFLPMDLQFFAEGDPAPSDPPGGNEPGANPPAEPPKPQDPPKTFTQEDINNIAAKEAKKAQEKLLKQLGIDDFNSAKEGLEKFKEWQESQKTEAQKQKEQLESLSNEKESLASENENLKAQLSALKHGVKADSVEDVVALAERLVSDDVTIDDAIKQVVEKYPQFSAEEPQQGEGSKPTFTTGQHQTSGNPNNDPFAAKLAKYNN